MRLIAFGDSLVAGAGDPDHLGWVGRAVAGRRAITLYNMGVRRETSADIATRWRAEALPRMADDEPMRIVFSFGANDCHPVGGAPRLGQAESLKNAQAMLSAAAVLCPVLLVGPPPMADPGVSARLEGLNENLKMLASRLKVPFIDVFQPLMADGLWRAEAIAWDGAHPGAGGYQRMADLVSAHPAWRSFTLAGEDSST
ncbi:MULTISPECIES: GDSL-type esterase/lipase family protein [Phenylobacterium]|uniref:Lysophospholipase L1-like esterase n=1 Tax=Phenylobacterium koreense TaxID=266125 RepID=A0ABV2EHI7_9CAUL